MLGNKRSNSKRNIKAESFLSKLYSILKNNNYYSMIHWDKDNKRMIVSDVINFSNTVLPIFYKHKNYSSFVRQLNMYRFHKSKGLIKNGESYEHEKLNKFSTKEQINQISRQNKKMKILSEYIKSNLKEEDSKSGSDALAYGNENDILKYLFERNKENENNCLNLKEEIEHLRKENDLINEKLSLFKSSLNSHKILLQNIIKRNNNNKNIKDKIVKAKTLNELFNKYLYYLKIYSPYVSFKNNNINK